MGAFQGAPEPMVWASSPFSPAVRARRVLCIGTVEEYSNRFQALLPCVGRVDEAQRVLLFTGGLLPPLSHDVRIHNPESLATTMSLAR